MRLPKLQMPTFTGAYTDWVSFNDLFQAAVSSSSLLSDSERLNYLKACINGDAAKLFSSLRITDANYPIAWQLLKDRYDNTPSIVHAHLQAIWSQSSMKVESGSGLRKLHETTNEHLRALEALGQPVNQCSAVLVFCIADKLDAESRKQWQLKMQKRKNVLRWDNLSKFLDERSRALESGAIKVIPQASKMSDQREPRHQSYAASITCSEICDVEHKLHACPEFKKMSTSQKYDLVKKKRACFNCLQTGHSVSECGSKFSCRECKAKHHTLLHRQKPAITLHFGSNKTIARVSTSANTTIQSAGSAGQQADTSVLTGHCGSGSPKAGALLPTAMVPIHNKSGERVHLRALLDSGSQVSFIREAKAKALMLKVQKTPSIIITLGASSSQKTCGVLPATIAGSIDVNFHVIPKITGALPNAIVDISQMRHVDHLKLADANVSVPGKIDMLLGADIIEDLMMDNRIRDNGLILRESLLGWIVSGPIMV